MVSKFEYLPGWAIGGKIKLSKGTLEAAIPGKSICLIKKVKDSLELSW